MSVAKALDIMVPLDEMVPNLLWVYHRANDAEKQAGKTWYSTARDFCEGIATLYGRSLSEVCAVTAIFSRQADWDRNRRMVREFYLEGKTRFASESQHKQADALYQGIPIDEVTRGFKQLNFYACIVNPHDTVSVCVDTHAMNAATCTTIPPRVRQAIFASRRLYEAFAEAYREGAASIGILPSEFQAVVWVTWRKNKRDLLKHIGWVPADWHENNENLVL